jgi:hypothetical protein
LPETDSEYKEKMNEEVEEVNSAFADYVYRMLHLPQPERRKRKLGQTPQMLVELKDVKKKNRVGKDTKWKLPDQTCRQTGSGQTIYGAESPHDSTLEWRRVRKNWRFRCQSL